MVYVPQSYVTPGSNNNNNNNTNASTRQPQNSYVTGGGSYAPPAANSSSVYAPAPAGGYGAATSSTTPSPAYSYAPAPAGGYSTGSYGANSYAPSSSPVPSSTYNASSNNTARNNTARNNLPDFSQALNLPPPTAHPTVAAGPASSTYGAPIGGNQTKVYASTATTTTTAPYNPGYNPVVAIPVNNTGGYSSSGYNSSGYSGDTKLPLAAGSVAASALNSSTYTGGPTGGLISEGNPTQCHKVDYEIKGHEMQIVEIELDPSEVVIAEASAMMYMDE